MRRLARRFFWSRPALYSPIGILRGKGNLFATNHQLYICGYPRSANTFALKAFGLANPRASVRAHKHVAPYIIQSMKRHTPGMVMIRNPQDAAVSWAIYTGLPLTATLGYYVDYYSVLLPYREELFFAAFEDVTSDFGRVTKAFNDRWNTNFIPFETTPENVARCMTAIENDFTDPDGNISEMRVARPSELRRPRKHAILAELNRSPALQAELHRAQKIYQVLNPRFVHRKPEPTSRPTQTIRLRPAV